MLVHPSSIDLSSRTLRHLSAQLHARRREVGTRRRRLPTDRQALLALAHLRRGDTCAQFAAGFRIGIATVYRCIREVIDVLVAIRTHDLLASAERACWPHTCRLCRALKIRYVRLSVVVLMLKGGAVDVVALSSEIVPYLTAAVVSYGTAVLVRTEESAADTTVALGQRLLQRLRGGEAQERIDNAVEELAADPSDPDLQAVLRVAVREALHDRELAGELAAIVGQHRTAVAASGERSVAVQHNAGVIVTGDNGTVQR